tara:strand:- start:161 stop:514 length:354 start_codon:yes stop_codon:yes gene_type:complete
MCFSAKSLNGPVVEGDSTSIVEEAEGVEEAAGEVRDEERFGGCSEAIEDFLFFLPWREGSLTGKDIDDFEDFCFSFSFSFSFSEACIASFPFTFTFPRVLFRFPSEGGIWPEDGTAM